MSKWYPNKLRASRQAKYEAAAGEGAKWQQNCKRRAFAFHFIAANRKHDGSWFGNGTLHDSLLSSVTSARLPMKRN
jgi:hypothetical protein